MKKLNHTKVALFAGATALMSLTPNIHAQSSVDALLNKLEQKGILTVDEAKELKAENETNSIADFNAAMNSRFPMPDWVTGYKLSGDFRGRAEEFTSDNPSFADRMRFRYRIRAGLAVELKDNLEVGFRVTSGDTVGGFGTSTGNPLSNNSTFQDDFTKKFLFIDAAYGKWTAINNDDWVLSATFGKMDNPFQLTPMVFDSDLTPEGAALQTTYNINDKNSITFIGAGFVLDEEKANARDPIMYGGQVVWKAKWTPRLESSAGIAAFDIVNRDQLTTANVPYVNQGNTRTTSTTASLLVYNYNPIVADASVTYKLDSFPLYPTAFPIKFAAEYMNNPGAPSGNEGYWGGVTFGQAGHKHGWDISYRYEYLEADAWYDQMVDDDNGAYYKNAPVGALAAGAFSGTSYGWFAGTNIKGHLIKADYSITDGLTFTFTCFINDLINQTPGGVAEPQNHAVHAMADLTWKF
jgi:hypothetical protein